MGYRLWAFGYWLWVIGRGIPCGCPISCYYVGADRCVCPNDEKPFHNFCKTLRFYFKNLSTFFSSQKGFCWAEYLEITINKINIVSIILFHYLRNQEQIEDRINVFHIIYRHSIFRVGRFVKNKKIWQIKQLV